LIERFARFGKFHFLEAIRDENGNFKSFQGLVCHLYHLLHQMRIDALE